MKPLKTELTPEARRLPLGTVLFFLLLIVIPAIGNGEVTVTAVPIARTSQLPPAPVEERIDTPQARYRGLKPFGEISIDSNPASGPLPEDLSGDFFPEESVQLKEMREVRDWAVTEFYWQATDFYHHPLYFDDPSLEVCGRSADKHLQPLLSGTRFFLTIPLLPVKIAQTPPHVHISTLGLCRPGSPELFLPQECASDCCECSAE